MTRLSEIRHLLTGGKRSYVCNIVRYFFPFGFMIILNLFLGCDQAPAQRVKPTNEQKSCSDHLGKLEREVKLNNEYTLRLYSLGIGNVDAGYDSFEIVQKERKVYSQSEGHFLVMSVKNGEVIPASSKEAIHIKDMTGDGIPDLIISEWEGGAHCCFNVHIFSLGPDFKRIAKIEGGHSGIEFKDFNGDGIYELVAGDWTFAYWETVFSDSPAPEIILRYKDGRYVLATDLMKKAPPSHENLEKKLIQIRNEFGGPEAAPNQNPKWSQRGGVPAALWAYMLDLIYTGNGNLAFDFFDKAWPDWKEAKKEFLDAFKKELSQSPYWHGIRMMNGWI